MSQLKEAGKSEGAPSGLSQLLAGPGSEQVADLLGGSADEIIFTSGATEANNHAILGAAQKGRGGVRKRIIISSIEHKCVIEAANAAHDLYGFIVEVAPVNQFGLIDFDWLQSQLDESVLLVSVMAANNEIGTLQDLPRIARLAHEVGALFHSDCAQAPMAMDMREAADHLDMASLSGHKMYGPKGIGVLWVERSIQSHLFPAYSTRTGYFVPSFQSVGK
jgi:cysteine desulfurase